MPWALVFAAAMAAGFTFEPKNLRRNEMVGDGLWSNFFDGLSKIVDEDGGLYLCSDLSALRLLYRSSRMSNHPKILRDDDIRHFRPQILSALSSWLVSDNKDTSYDSIIF